MTRRTLPGTAIQHWGLEGERVYKIGWRNEAAAERAGYIVKRRGTSYVYVRKPIKSSYSGSRA